MGSIKTLTVALGLSFLASSVHSGVVNMPGYNVDLFDPIDLSGLKPGVVSGEGIRKTLIPFYVDEVLEFLERYPQADNNWLLDGVDNVECKGHVMEWVRRVIPLDPLVLTNDSWVLRMFDAWGKPPEGLLSGHVNALGDFDECVDLKVTDLDIRNTNFPNVKKNFVGRYCNTYLSPYVEGRFGKYFNKSKEAQDLMELLKVSTKESMSPIDLIELMAIQVGIKILPSIGICFPDSCAKSDIERIMVNAFDYLYQPVYWLNKGNVTKEDMLWPAVEFCYVAEKPDYDAADYSVMTLLIAILAICIIASLVDMHLNRGLEKPPRRGLAFQYLNSFSLYTNIPRWMNTRPSADDLGCLHGIRFLSTSWVILAHTWYVVTFIPYWNMVDVKKLHEDWKILTILNSTVSVDTFFVLSGLLVAYNVLKLLHKTKGKLNIFMFYVHRYLRLTPVYAVLIGVMATLLPYMGRGPYWVIMERWGNICENNWWTNMLYVNNFVNTSWLCQGEAWYLANDMQFYIVSPFILYPLYRWEMIGLVILAVSTILSSLSPALMVHFLDTVPTTIGTRDSSVWFSDIYIKPYARIQTYFIGIWLGWLLFKTKGKKVNIPMPLVLLFWLISTGSVLAVLYGIMPWFDPSHEIPEVPSIIYAGLNRLAWSVSVSWIIFACVKGYGWIVNDFLCWTAFIPLGRLCYCVFLVSLHLQMALNMQFKQPIGYSNYTMVNFFFGHMVMSFIVGFIFTITIETPFMQIEKLIFEGGAKPEGAKPPGSQAVSGLPQGQGTILSNRNGIFYHSADTTPNGQAKFKEDKEN